MRMRFWSQPRPLLLAVLFAAVGLQPALAQQELPLGSKRPQINQMLVTVEGRQVQPDALKGAKGTIFVFWSNDCAWVSKYEDRILELADAYGKQGYSFVFINSNDPVAFPKETAAEGRKRGYNAPYVVDEGSQLAKALGASRTPHIFFFDADDVLIYSGTIDDSPGDPGNASKMYLKEALDAVSQGRAVAVPQTKAFGCTIRLQ